VDWLKKLFGVKTNFEIMLEHVNRSHERDIELIRLQMGTIDRIVAACYDRPTIAHEPVSVPKSSVDDLVDVNVDDETWMARQ
jgi:hypothetical protein